VRALQRLRRDIGFISMMLVVGFVTGSTFVTVSGSSLSFLTGGIAGFSIATILAMLDLLVFPLLSRWPFGALLLVRSVAYAGVALTIVFLSFFLTGSAPSFASNPVRLLATILITLTICYVANFLLAIRRVLGKHVLWWLLIGRYRRPIEENRMFMFIDLASSTALAEKIGHVMYHQLIHKFQCDIAEVILDSGGDIYKYVGDEVIVTWLLSDAQPDNRWVECFFRIREAIHEKHDQYRRMFGIVPQFRVSLHCGMVVAGEMGDWKREVGFIGDTVNTAARILDACKSNNRDFIVSDEVMRRIANIEKYVVEPVPEAALRGKSGRVTLFSVEDH